MVLCMSGFIFVQGGLHSLPLCLQVSVHLWIIGREPDGLTPAAQVSSLSAQVLALRTERDDLEARLAKGTSAAGRLEVELAERTEHLSRSLRAKAEEAGAAAAAAHRERQDKVRSQGSDVASVAAA
jgi:hypothetical protein